jgi:hypothetical protein
MTGGWSRISLVHSKRQPWPLKEGNLCRAQNATKALLWLYSDCWPAPKLFLVIALITQLQSHRLKALENFLEGSPTVGYGLSGACVFRLAAGGEKNGSASKSNGSGAWGRPLNLTNVIIAQVLLMKKTQ